MSGAYKHLLNARRKSWATVGRLGLGLGLGLGSGLASKRQP